MEFNDLVNEYNFRKCRGPEEADVEQLVEAFEFFCANYVYIKHPSRGRIEFELRPAQIATVRAWLGHRNTIVLKARQIGFSTLALQLLHFG